MRGARRVDPALQNDLRQRQGQKRQQRADQRDRLAIDQPLRAARARPAPPDAVQRHKPAEQHLIQRIPPGTLRIAVQVRRRAVNPDQRPHTAGQHEQQDMLCHRDRTIRSNRLFPFDRPFGEGFTRQKNSLRRTGNPPDLSRAADARFRFLRRRPECGQHQHHRRRDPQQHQQPIAHAQPIPAPNCLDDVGSRPPKAEERRKQHPQRRAFLVFCGKQRQRRRRQRQRRKQQVFRLLRIRHRTGHKNGCEEQHTCAYPFFCHVSGSPSVSLSRVVSIIPVFFAFVNDFCALRSDFSILIVSKKNLPPGLTNAENVV